MAPQSGALLPPEASDAVLRAGVHHLEEPLLVTFIQNIYGAMCISAGGLLSVTIGAGFAGIQEQNNPGIQRLFQGATFPLGLVLVYLVGAELFTGYPMWYTMCLLERKGKPIQYVRGAITAWTGNLLGALLFSAMFTNATEALEKQPWHSAIVEQITEDIVDLQWHVIFLRAIGCGWLTTIAMYLGTQNQDGISKALCLHFPFMISASSRFPHIVEYMYLATTGMQLGAPLSIVGFIWKCLLPVTLGNIVGGGIFTGAYLWWIHVYSGNRDKYDDGNLDGDLLDEHE